LDIVAARIGRWDVGGLVRMWCGQTGDELM
jgi:hypothetical protein